MPIYSNIALLFEILDSVLLMIKFPKIIYFKLKRYYLLRLKFTQSANPLLFKYILR